MIQPRILIIGEAWGEQEALTKRAFVGSAGQELRKMLKEAGLDPNKVDYTNVFNFRPEGNKIESLCTDKRTAVLELEDIKRVFPDAPWPLFYNYPALAGPGKYLRPRYFPSVWQLIEKLKEPWDLLIPLGNVATWAILGNTGITRLRGYVAKSSFSAAKVLPSFHPAAILRNWALRPISIADLIKAKGLLSQSETDDPRELWIEPNIADIRTWIGSKIQTSDQLTVDIETIPKKRLITCVGFGTAQSAISIPFVDRRIQTKNYWSTLEEEITAWGLVKAILALPNDKIWQNGIYDIQWLWARMGLCVAGTQHDTMLIHHALFPEMSKDLGFLGSIYTEGESWKGMRKKAKLAINSEKKDD